MKRLFEEEHPEIFGALRCMVCHIEATGNPPHGRRVGDDEWLCPDHKHLERVWPPRELV